MPPSMLTYMHTHTYNHTGVNQPGTVWKYLMRDLSGYMLTQQAVQLSQSSHMALSLPYVVMGLGATTYFIEVGFSRVCVCIFVYVGTPANVSL